MENKLRKAIREKGCALGTVLMLSTPAMVEQISSSGLDFVMIDTEHGTYDLSEAAQMILSAEAKGLCPVLRISDPTHREIQHAVDNGAEGIIVPCLRDIDDFRKVAELGKFAPLGNRGYTLGRGSCFGNEPWASGSMEEYMKNSNDKVLLLPQCETAEALEQIEQITAIEGLDGIFIGPFDLSICMGIPGQFDNPQFIAAMDRIQAACKANGKICITHTSSKEEAREALKKGFDGITYSLDGTVLSAAYRQAIGFIRG